MNARFRIFKRASGVFYLEDTVTLHQESLKTKDKSVAQTIVSAKNQAHEQPALNLQMARTYLAASDPAVVERTWQIVMEAIMNGKQGPTHERWQRAIKDPAFDSIRNRRILDTRAEQFWSVLKNGSVSTNVFLRRLHNLALDMSWLPWPIIPKKQWPPVRFKAKRAITAQEHRRIIEIEWEPERKAYYELLWHLGGAQSDVAALRAEDVDWTNQVISYARMFFAETRHLPSSESNRFLMPLELAMYPITQEKGSIPSPMGLAQRQGPAIKTRWHCVFRLLLRTSGVNRTSL
jgi:hypothetical protein